MKLEEVSLTPPDELENLLADRGDGENGFVGTSVPNGAVSLEEYLQGCCDMSRGRNLKPGMVPQTVFWMIDADGAAIGMVKVRHRLNDKLRLHGGHIGYFIRSDKRGKGFGKRALALSLVKLHQLGESRALITVTPDNIPSVKTVEANGGQFEEMSADPETGIKVKKYWIPTSSD